MTIRNEQAKRSAAADRLQAAKSELDQKQARWNQMFDQFTQKQKDSITQAEKAVNDISAKHNDASGDPVQLDSKLSAETKTLYQSLNEERSEIARVKEYIAMLNHQMDAGKAEAGEGSEEHTNGD